MGRFSVITLTDAAADRVQRDHGRSRERRRHPRRHQEGRLRRHGIHGRPRHRAEPCEDDHVEHAGAHVWVAPEATLFLLGTEMDFETTKLRTGFTFRNPNQSSACGCGELVELKPADLKKLAEARAAG